jgi:CRP-like cAMP-binding protein
MNPRGHPERLLREWLPPDILRVSATRGVRAGQVLFRQGDKTFAIFEVETGGLQLVRHDRSGRRIVLFNAGAGDSLAEAALFSKHYHCDAVAITDSTVRVYPKPALLSALRTNPLVGERFMAVLANQVQSLRTRLEQRNIRSARERVLRHLALAAGPDGRTVPIKGTLKHLAEELGLTHEALYRTLAALEAAGLIRRNRGSIALVRAKRSASV